MVELYADLVQLKLRALDENDKGIVLVPAFLKEKVRLELKKREFYN